MLDEKIGNERLVLSAARTSAGNVNQLSALY